MEIVKKWWWLGGVLLLLSFLVFTRFYQLKSVPGSLTHDEVVYAIQAKSYVLQGTNLTQDHRPWSIKPIHPLYAEWPATIMSLGFLISNNSQIASHFSSALMGVLLPFVFGWLAWGLWQKKELAIISTIITASSPLLWQFSRLSYDTFYSAFFYVLGGALLVNLKNRQKLWSLLSLTIGFFQYQGLKLLLVPWVLMIFLLEMFGEKFKPNLKNIWDKGWAKFKTEAGWVLILTTALTLIFGTVLLPRVETNGRLSRNIFTDTAQFAKSVNTERRLSLTTPLAKFASNKITVTQKFVIDRLFGSFNPWLLFMNGEPNTTGFAVWTHGIFYLLDGILILLGLSYLFSQEKTRSAGVILLGSVVVFSAPNLINTMSEWHMMRTFLAYVTLLFIISWGAYLVWQQKIWRWALVLLYGVSVLNFSYHYFFRYPITNLDAGTFDERLVAKYVSLAEEKTDKNIVVYTQTADMTFFNYLLYEQKMASENLGELKMTVEKNIGQKIRSYQLGRITFTDGCVDIDADQITLWEINHTFCQNDEEPDQELMTRQEKFRLDRLTIPAVLDSGEAYRIQNDAVCSQYELNSFAHLQNLHQLDLAKMNDQEFCQTWITDLRPLNL